MFIEDLVWWLQRRHIKKQWYYVNIMLVFLIIDLLECVKIKGKCWQKSDKNTINNLFCSNGTYNVIWHLKLHFQWDINLKNPISQNKSLIVYIYCIYSMPLFFLIFRDIKNNIILKVDFFLCGHNLFIWNFQL